MTSVDEYNTPKFTKLSSCDTFYQSLAEEKQRCNGGYSSLISSVCAQRCLGDSHSILRSLCASCKITILNTADSCKYHLGYEGQSSVKMAAVSSIRAALNVAASVGDFCTLANLNNSLEST